MKDIEDFKKLKENLFIDFNANNYDILVDLLKIGLKSIKDHDKNGPTYPIKSTQKLSDIIQETKMPNKSIKPDNIMKDIYKELEGCQKAGHNRMYKNVLPQANALGLVANLIGNIYMPNGVTGEDAGNTVNTELKCASAISELAGIDKTKSAGIFTFGGTATNLYAIKLGLIKAFPEHIKEGNIRNIVVIGSNAAHYCHEVDTNWLGIGENNFIKAKSNQDQTTNIEDLKIKIISAIKSGKKIACIILSGGTTSNMGIDNVKEIYDFRKKIIDKYNLNYIPHIHFDSVIGWAYLNFKNYNLTKNKYGFSNMTCEQIKKIMANLKSIKYADSFGVDFHKAGYVQYISSMIILKNREDLNLLKKNKQKTTPLFHDELAYNPGIYTLETSRSAASMVATWLSLKSIGKQGYQMLLGNALDNGNKFRQMFNNKIYNGLYIINRDNFGPDIFLGCAKKIEEYDKLINDNNILEENNKLTSDFANWLIKKRKSGMNAYTISKSSAAIYNKNGKSVIGIRIYPLSPYINNDDMEILYNNLMEDKIEYSNKH